MTRSLLLYGGPHDGDTIDAGVVLSTFNSGETFTVKGALYRIDWNRRLAYFVPMIEEIDVGWAGYPADPPPEVSDPWKIEFRDPADVPATPGLTGGEAILALLIGGSIGIGVGLALVVVTLLGSWMHQLVGSYMGLVLWPALAGALTVLAVALIRPVIVRDERNP